MENNTIQINVLALMYGLGFLGVLAHWAKAALNKQASWNLLSYLLTDKPGASGSMLAAYTAAMGGLYAVGAFDIVRIEYVLEAWHNGILYKPFLHAVLEVVMAGYICDSGLNKSTPNVERRAEYSLND